MTLLQALCRDTARRIFSIMWLPLWLGFLSPSALAQGIDLVEVLYATGYDGRGSSSQGVLTYRHTAPWAIGDNFFFVDFSNIGNFENAGSTYMEWGPRLSIGRTLGGEPWRFGLIRDVYVVGELNYVHNKHVVNTTTLYGLSFDLALPGFQVFKMHLEHRDDPDLAGTSAQLSLIWNYPFRLGDQQFSVEGFFDLVSPEGGNHGSMHTQPQLLWKMNQRVNLGLEYQYWRNKQGRAGFTESVMQGMVRINF